MNETPAAHQQALTERQFGASASAYLTSAVHAGGADLDALAERAAAGRPGEVLDLGCGAGHASFALARGGAGRVVAYDLSREMLEVVAEEAARRGHAGLVTRQGPAEQLPFESGRFDWVATRYSAHHWRDVPAALAEARRVLKPRGRLFVIDIVAPESPLLDTVLQSVEFLRDASHVRNYRLRNGAACSARRASRTPTLSCGSCGWNLSRGSSASGRPPNASRRCTRCSPR